MSTRPEPLTDGPCFNLWVPRVSENGRRGRDPAFRRALCLHWMLAPGYRRCSLFRRGACHHHPPLLISRIPLSSASSPLFPATVTATGLGQNYDNERALWLHLLRIGRRGRA